MLIARAAEGQSYAATGYLLMNPRYILVLIGVLCLCGSNPQSLKAQTPTPEAEVEIVPATARGCQRNTIDVANLGALVQTTKEKALVIARLGRGETNRLLNRRRLNDVKTEFGINWDASKIILAEGERVKGQGRIEFYLGSELMSVSLLARNGDFCATCCDRRNIFYKERWIWRSGRKNHR